MIGKVMEVFLPDNDFDMIGFKVLIDDELLELVMEQTEDNLNIYKDDIVKVSYTNDGISIENIENDR